MGFNKITKLVLSFLMLLTCFNFVNVHAEDEGDNDNKSNGVENDISSIGENENGAVTQEDENISVLSDGEPSEDEPVVSYVAKIVRDGNDFVYNSLSSAITDANEGETIVLLDNISENITIEKNVIIDLNEKTITGVSSENEYYPVVTINSSSVTLSNGTITKGTNSGVKVSDSCLTLNKMNIFDNEGKTLPQGSKQTFHAGGILSENSDLTINESIIDSNKSTHVSSNGSPLGDGGGISFLGDKILKISKSKIINNHANNCGGGIKLRNGAKIYAYETEISNNISDVTAGGIHFDDESTGVEILSCKINNNTSKNIGGGMYVASTASITLGNTEISGNKLTSSAGQGGGIVVYSGNIKLISNTVLKENSSTYGAAIYSLNGKVEINYSNLLNNNSIFGSGIFAFKGNVEINSSKITGNISSSYGGGIYGYYANIKVNESEISNNKSSRAGGVFAYANTTVEVEDSSISNNIADVGAGLYIWNSNAILNSTEIENNTASYYAGGIYNDANGTIELSSDSKLYNNTVPNDQYGASDYFGDGKFTFSKISNDTDCILSETGHLIDGWYYDGYYSDDTTEENKRWNVAEYTNEFTNFNSDNSVTVSGRYALKAAHSAYKGYTVNYIDEDTSEKLLDAIGEDDIRVETEVEVETAEVANYVLDKVEVSGEEKELSDKVTLKIDKDESKNVITFYYKALKNYIVQYVDKDTNENLLDPKTVESTKVGTEISENALEIDGYTLDGASSKKLVIDLDETKNVITFYYTKNVTPVPTVEPTVVPENTSTDTTPATPTNNNTTPVTPVTPTRRTTPNRNATPVAPETDSTPTATPEATVEPTETPEATATPEVIDDDETPEVAPKGNWALINLIAAMLSVLLGVIAILAKHKDEDEDEEDETEDENVSTRHRRWKIVSAIDAIVAVVAFILTEDITQKMVMVDKWTILMVVIAVVGVVSMYFARKWQKEDEETSEDAQ